MRNPGELFPSLSKDPDGFSPSFNESLPLDPVGSMPAEIATPSHAEHNDQQSSMDVARMVGAPPPPPPMPPPARRSGSRSRSRPNARPKPTPEGMFQPKTQARTKSKTDANARTQLSVLDVEDEPQPFRPSNMTSPFNESKAMSQQASPSTTAQSLSFSADSASSSIALERRRAALEMYKSDGLVLDQNATEPSVSSSPMHGLNLLPSKTADSLNLTFSDDIENTMPETQLRSTKSVSKSPAAAPAAVATPTIHKNSNVEKVATTIKNRPAISFQEKRAALSSPRSAAVEQTNTSSHRADTATAGNTMAKSPRRNVTSSQMMQKSQAKDSSNKKSEKKNKRGFLKKIFGGKKSKEMTTAAAPTPTPTPTPFSPPQSFEPEMAKQGSSIVQSRISALNNKTSPTNRKSSPKQRVYNLNVPSPHQTAPGQYAPVPSPATSAASSSKLNAPSLVDENAILPKMTMDPPDDNDDPPLQLTFSDDHDDDDDEDDAIKSPSHEKSTSEDQDTSFFSSQDEFAAEATAKISPVAAASNAQDDPIGDYDSIIPQSTRVSEQQNQSTQATGGLRLNVHLAQTADPSGDSPVHANMLATPGARVTPANRNTFVMDPLGDSPLAAVGFLTEKQPHHETMDPVGESTEHQPLEPREEKDQHPEDPAAAFEAGTDVSDPPLEMYDGYVSEESEGAYDGEEKKEDEHRNHADKKATAISPENPAAPHASKPSPERSVNKPTNKLFSSATKAALRLTKPPAMGALRDQLDKVPTPTHDDQSRVGLAPIMDSDKNEKMAATKTPRARMRRPLQIDTKRTTTQDDDTDAAEETATDTKTPSKPPAAITKNNLSVTSAAYTNAKAVAYLHKLQGSPSPRHSWHRSNRSQQEEENARVNESIANLRLKSSSKKKLGGKPTSAQQPPPQSPYGWHDKYMGTEIESPSRNVPPKKGDLVIHKDDQLAQHPPPPEERIVGTKLSGYRSNFKGRRPGKKSNKAGNNASGAQKANTPTSSNGSKINKAASSSRLAGASGKAAKTHLYVVTIPPGFQGTITSMAVSRGINLRRKKRIDDIESGRSTPVVLTPRQKPTGGNRFNFVPADESEIKDPIQRAGRRLLSKAAIPIQCAARRFIAKREAVDRMWALIEIQSYFRRWRAETNLQAYTHSSTVIQSGCRRYLTRKRIGTMHVAATDIQKIIRGYLASAFVYDQMFFVVQIQSTVRMFLGKLKAKAYRAQVDRAVPLIQSQWRGFMCRQDFYEVYAESMYAAAKIQAVWRSFDARNRFQFEVVDIIIVQSVLRRWFAKRYAQQLRYEKEYDAIARIQRTWRAHHAFTTYMKYMAARKIQTSWRRHEAHAKYSDYMAARKIQTSWRRHDAHAKYSDYMAARKIQSMWRCCIQRVIYDEYIAARKIQAMWRCHRQHNMFLEYVTARLLQSAWRRHVEELKYRKYLAARSIQSTWRTYFGRTTYGEYKAARRVQATWKMHLARRQFRKYKASQRIQAVWRGQRELTTYRRIVSARKIQAAWRGFQAYTDYIFSLVDILVVQRTIRQWLAMRKARAIRANNAATLIQKEFRRFKAQTTLVYTMVQIIVTQSVVRRYIARYRIQERNAELEVERQAALRRDMAATRIQSAWRGFWGFSHYIIIQYEVTRLQSLIRGKLARQAYSLKLGCAIIIQATVRQHQARQNVASKLVHDALVNGKIRGLCERNAAKKVQFWWRIVMDWMREKKAALVIERFFIHVRVEVDREIRRRERKRHTKKEKRRRKKRENEDQLLERVWLNTLDEEEDATTAVEAPKSTKSRNSDVKLSPKSSTPRAGGNVTETADAKMKSNSPNTPKSATSMPSKAPRQKSPTSVPQKPDQSRVSNERPAAGMTSPSASSAASMRPPSPYVASNNKQPPNVTGLNTDAPSQPRSTSAEFTTRSASPMHHRSRSAAAAAAAAMIAGASPKSASSPSSKQVEIGQPRTTPRNHAHKKMPQNLLRPDRHQESAIPTDMVQIAPSEDASEISNITNPTSFLRSAGSPTSSSALVRNGRSSTTPRPTSQLQDVEESSALSLAEEEAFLDLKPKRRKPKTADDYIRKYANKGSTSSMPSPSSRTSNRSSSGRSVSANSVNGMKTSTDSRNMTNNSSSRKSAHFFAEGSAPGMTNPADSNSGTPRSSMSTPVPRSRSSPRSRQMAISVSTQPQQNHHHHQHYQKRATPSPKHIAMNDASSHAPQRSVVPPSPTARSTKNSRQKGSFFPQPTPPRHEKYVHASREIASLETGLTQSTTMTPTSSSGNHQHQHQQLLSPKMREHSHHQFQSRSPVRVLKSFHQDEMDVLGEEFGEV